MIIVKSINPLNWLEVVKMSRYAINKNYAREKTIDRSLTPEEAMQLLLGPDKPPRRINLISCEETVHNCSFAKVIKFARDYLFDSRNPDEHIDIQFQVYNGEHGARHYFDISKRSRGETATIEFFVPHKTKH